MSRSTTKTGDSGIPKSSLLKPPKRERSSSVEAISRKKLKPAEPKDGLFQKPQQPSFKHVRAWLSEASQTELDNLFNFLARQRKKSDVAAEKLGDARNRSSSIRNDKTEVKERKSSRRRDPDCFVTAPPTVVKPKITARGLRIAEAELFPQEMPRLSTKVRLCDRWARRTETADTRWSRSLESAPDKPPGLDISDAILNAAKSRYSGLWSQFCGSSFLLIITYRWSKLWRYIYGNYARNISYTWFFGGYFVCPFSFIFYFTFSSRLFLGFTFYLLPIIRCQFNFVLRT